MYLASDGTRHEWFMPEKNGGQGPKRALAAPDALGVKR
ncbi:hypothetical protein J2853_002242 [Streptosporangium lutulentum]|uniref:Uncharacterized protein n=1 Tax=Streptosporangium lutulentum TaxID=1461250 RepID=A0ABT9Q8H8_9ACTN|nr:hypothetical protein [Streptosporangium lutulentum]